MRKFYVTCPLCDGGGNIRFDENGKIIDYRGSMYFYPKKGKVKNGKRQTKKGSEGST